jgi:hypothetical protein
MPMIPSFAAFTYGAIKLGGYALYAYWLNRRFKSNVSPFNFALVKTFVGFVAGWGFLSLGSNLPQELQSNFAFWLSALPLRLFAWLLVIGYFYKSKSTYLQLLLYSVLGIVITYSLDLVMFGLFKLLPGMQIPMC